MPNILVINSGSTSIKFKVFGDKGESFKEGSIDNVTDYDKAIKNILRQIGDFRDIAGIGHRVVHGGEKFFEPTVINDKVISELEKISELAPLHNPYNLAGVKAAINFLPDIPEAAVFDTGFYRDLPETASFYALPKQLSLRYKIRRYGFHGISHELAGMEGAKKLGLDFKKANLITCHLGGGWSVTAIKNGKAVDTSMGFTPMEGLMMMTRSGDIDPGIIFLLMKHRELLDETDDKGRIIMDFSHSQENAVNVHEEDLMARRVENILNQESGIKGLTEGISDYKELLKAVSLGKESAKTAFDMAIRRLVKYIGSYYAILEGNLDGIIFTGRIGAGNPMTRNSVMRKLKFLKCPGIPIEPNEEKLIADKVRELLKI
ncbi:MAG: acetate kinase [Patescibacteria group bacterium]|jgi:acetate kinase